MLQTLKNEHGNLETWIWMSKVVEIRQLNKVRCHIIWDFPIHWKSESKWGEYDQYLLQLKKNWEDFRYCNILWQAYQQTLNRIYRAPGNACGRKMSLGQQKTSWIRLVCRSSCMISDWESVYGFLNILFAFLLEMSWLHAQSIAWFLIGEVHI